MNFDFAYPVNSKDGKPATTMGKSFAPSLTEAQLADVRMKGVSFKYALDLPPGQYAVRFVARQRKRKNRQRHGAVNGELTKQRAGKGRFCG